MTVDIGDGVTFHGDPNELIQRLLDENKKMRAELKGLRDRPDLSTLPPKLAGLVADFYESIRARKCDRCGKEITVGSARGKKGVMSIRAKYCSNVCRTNACRDRKKSAAEGGGS